MFGEKLKLFQRSKGSIWTDKYISKELLKCHLDEFSDGASRKLEKREKIINFLNENMDPSSRILDLGCGPGLIDFELGKLGYNILGVDFNSESINYANKNKKLENIEYICKNYLTEDLKGKYDIVLMIYCDFGALIPSEQKIILKKIYDLLSDDGIFIFDVFKTSEFNIQKSIKSFNNWRFLDGNDFWNKDPYLLLEEVKVFDKDNAIGKRYFIINKNNSKRKEFILWDQYYDENSIENLLLENKFKIKKIKNSLLDGEDSMFIISEKNVNFDLKNE